MYSFNFSSLYSSEIFPFSATFSSPNLISILSGDILKVNIKSNNPISSEIIESSSQIYNQTRESLMFQGYLVDKEGYINIPEIGKVNVLNLSGNTLWWCVEYNEDKYTGITINIF